MKNYDKNKESPYLKHWDVNKWYGWEMSQHLPVKIFKWVEEISAFNEDFIKSFIDKKKMNDILFKRIFSIPKICITFTMNYHFYQKEWKLKKVEKIVANLHDKSKYFIHIRTLKQALNHELVLKKVRRIIKLNQETWLKPYLIWTQI